MRFSMKLVYIILLFIILLGIVVYLYLWVSTRPFFKSMTLAKPPVITNTTPYNIQVGDKTKVKYPEDYTLLLLGDSMTEMLGNSDELRKYLFKYFPKKTFEVLNYGYGSTNILSAQERLVSETWHGRVFRPILDIDFDAILIESFGNNPLSTFSLEEGLKKQTEALDKIVETIKNSNPRAKIVFVATISPNKKKYAEGQVNLAPEQRLQWVNERIAYIKNHIAYASSHNIPLIDIFDKSLNSDGDGNIDYISSNDFIHPSASGVFLISEQTAKFISENQILTP